MIPEAEVRRTAGRLGIDPMLVNLDYVIGWTLSALSDSELRQQLLFKGGTCLSKCYIQGYRFSEDLDFTALKAVSEIEFEQRLTQSLHAVGESTGIDFFAEPLRVELISDEHGVEWIEAKAYYRGPMRLSGSPPAIRIHVTRDELVVFGANLRPLSHPYSDRGDIQQQSIPCYDLAEIMAEKIRALMGQRIYAVSRDIYDLQRLLQQNVDVTAVREALPVKFAARKLPLQRSAVRQIRERKAEYAADWDRNLVRLLPEGKAAQFDEAWAEVLSFVSSMVPENG